MATIDTTKKAALVKSIPSSTIDFLLSCIEKHCAIKDEMKGIVVSTENSEKLNQWKINKVLQGVECFIVFLINNCRNLILE